MHNLWVNPGAHIEIGKDSYDVVRPRRRISEGDSAAIGVRRYTSGDRTYDYGCGMPQVDAGERVRRSRPLSAGQRHGLGEQPTPFMTRGRLRGVEGFG